MRRGGRGGGPIMAEMVRRKRPLLLALVVFCAVVGGGIDVVSGGCAGLAHLLPFVLIIVPLLAGRYIGEERLARLTGNVRAWPRRRAARALPSRRPARTVPRGGCLIASFLAVRPPPRSAALNA